MDVTLLTVALLVPSLCSCFYVSLDRQHNHAGSLLFNSSWTYGTSYVIDVTQTYSHMASYFGLLEDSGAVYLKHSLPCVSPVTFYVKSRGLRELTPVMRATMPITVLCSEDTTIPEDYVIIVERDNSCLEKSQLVVHLRPLLPSTLQHCSVVFDQPTDNNFAIERSVGDLVTRVRLRQLPSSITVTASVTCDYEQLLTIDILFCLPPCNYDKRTTGRNRREMRNWPPTFEKDLYIARVPEETLPGFHVITVNAADPEGTKITYSLHAVMDGRSQSMFDIGKHSGMVKTVGRLDREFMDKHYLRVTAADSGVPSKSATAMLEIQVNDVNDHSPVFEKEYYRQNIRENSPIWTTVITVRATDQDFGANAEMEYTLKDPNAYPFVIDPYSGDITITGRLDREITAEYELEVIVTDLALDKSERRSSKARVLVTVQDDNDNYPQFSESSYNVAVREDIDWTKMPNILQVQAKDADEGINSRVHYTIIGGNTQGHFQLDQVSGLISVVSQLDYESVRSYRLMIRAQDSGKPSRSNTTQILINVVDVNDNSPQFYADMIQESVIENVLPGHKIILVQAYDADDGENGIIEYSIKKPDPKIPIDIQPTTGWVVTTGTVDREVSAIHHFTVVATDRGTPPRLSTCQVTILIQDVNDNDPVFDPKIYEASVSELDPPGTHVISVRAHDSDADPRLTYHITRGNTRNRFSVTSNENEGVINVAQPLDFDLERHFALSVTTSDTGGRSDTATVYINVTDANTHRPIFEGSPYSASVPEDAPIGTTVLVVEAWDGDEGENARVTYTMDHVPEFIMDQLTGAIVTSRKLDRELISSYSLVVMARDHGIPALSDTTNVEIEISDINDNSPIFQLPKYIASISEDVLVGTSVLQVSAPDLDIGLNGQVRYTLSPNAETAFSVDPTSGIIRTERLLDRETVAIYELVMRAVDRGTPSLSATAFVTIRVEDVNDNPPSFEASRLNLFVTENTSSGSVVGEIEATDPDDGVNAIVYYSIVSGPDAHLFLLILRPGKAADLISKTEFDYESPKKRYSLVIRASSPPLRQDVDVDIWVTDVNDNAPVLKNFTVIVNVYGEYLPREPVGRVPAFDPDVGDQLQYRVLSGHSKYLLHIEEDTGIIRIHPNSEEIPPSANLEIGVFDGVNEVTANCNILIRRITDNVLRNSVTITLKGVTEKSFLSFMYEEFLDAIAAIVPCSKEDVIVFNVKGDTEVVGNVLNISFAVRILGTEKLYDRKKLEGLLYLKRYFLSHLIRAEVFPFEDDLCVQEPCVSYEECHSVTTYGNTSTFVYSETLIFRPIVPASTFSCKCPVGFTGMNHRYECDTEINPCYSSPCGSNGKCEQKENGFSCVCKEGYTGIRCEISSILGRCNPDVCLGNSYCLNNKDKGFKCLNCTHNELWSTEMCELKAVSFKKGSYLALPTLHRRHRFHIKTRFATQQKDGLLLYNGRYNDKNDFIALEIINSQVVFTFSVGKNISKVTVSSYVSDGQWHDVEVAYLNRSVILNVDNCDIVLALQFGHELGNYHCANHTSLELEERCKDPMQSCYRFLDLTTPLLVGGLPFLYHSFHSIKTTFVGCIADLYLDHHLIDFNSFLDNNGTESGCKEKNNFCEDHSCSNGGTCEEGWNSFFCHCKVGFSGKDCSKGEKSVKQFLQKGFLVYVPRLHPIQLPWLIGISFRTRKLDGLLMQIQLGVSSQIKLECLNGSLQYSFNNESLQAIDIPYADGKWHNVEATWTTEGVVLTFDYSQSQVKREFIGNIKGLYVGKILVGGLEPGNESKQQAYFEGCIKDVQVGGIGDSWTSPVLQDNVQEGCSAPDVCNSNSCPQNSQCIDLWHNFSCHCNQGHVGQLCKPVCTINPCLNGGTCIVILTEKQTYSGYKCLCSEMYSGKYCETFLNHSCPSMWWGHPICGPCNCDIEKGYDANCDKNTGKCKCEENHYQLPHSDFCIPCNCYAVGSYNSQCNILTGQCHCRLGVIGRQCDSCSNPFAEVTLRGCEVIYGGCPKAFSQGIWWERTSFNFTAVQQCLDGAIGKAERHCSPRIGWEEPIVFGCTTVLVASLQVKLTDIREGKLIVNSSVISEMSENLRSISELSDPLYGNDVLIIFQLLHFLLHNELQLEIKNASHYHNNDFVQNIVLVISIILNPLYIKHWEQVTALTGRGPGDLLNLLEKYMHLIIRKDETNMPHSFEIAAENIILGVDTIDAMMYLKNYEDSDLVHFAALPFLDFSFESPAIMLPKYNNYPNTKKSRSDTSKAILPLKVVNPAITKADYKKRQKSCHLLKNCAIVSYAIYPTMGRLLSAFNDISFQQENEVITEINSDVFTLVMQPAGQTTAQNLSLSENVILRFQLLVPEGYENIQCAHWKSFSGGRGEWSSDGCVMIDQKYNNGKSYVNCSCNHLSSFAVLMDFRTQTDLVAESHVQSAFSYLGIILSLMMLLSTFIIFCLLRGTETNSNIIHKNLVSSIFIADLVFLIALKTQGKHLHQEFTCKLMAILLHYFFLSEFCWTLVESIHLYRMLTEMQDINHGQMRSYYFVGYGIPAIIVGLAIGIHADQYGNDIFCWLSIHDSVVWSLVAPICILVVLILGVFGISIHSTIETKETVTDFGNVRTVLWIGIILLPILGATWILAVLCVNESVVALHYIFIMFCLMEGVYIFFGYCIVNKKVRQYLLDALAELNNINFLKTVNSITTTRQSSYHAPFKVLHRSVGISTCSSASQSTAKTYSTPCKSESHCNQDITTTPPVKSSNSVQNPVLRPASLSSSEAPHSPPPPYEAKKVKENENITKDSSRKPSYARSMHSSCNSSKLSIPTIGVIGSYDVTPASNSFADMTDFEIPPLKLPLNLLSHNPSNWAGVSVSSPSMNEDSDEEVKKTPSHTQLSPCETSNDLNNTIRIHEVGALLESRFSPPLIDDSPGTSDSENPCSFYSLTDNCANSKSMYNDLSNADKTVSNQCNAPKVPADEKTSPPSKSKSTFISTYHAHLIPPLATAELSSDSE